MQRFHYSALLWGALNIVRNLLTSIKEKAAHLVIGRGAEPQRSYPQTLANRLSSNEKSCHRFATAGIYGGVCVEIIKSPLSPGCFRKMREMFV